MIFVTVGTQLPFDRLIRAVDDWAGRAGRSDVFAQIGPSPYAPLHLACKQFIGTQEFRDCVTQAELVIAHAGMGSILTALEMGKPILVLPRRAELNEHRNDHQLATAKHLQAQGRVHVAFDEQELLEKLERLDQITALERIERQASAQLISAISEFVQSGRLPKQVILARTAAIGSGHPAVTSEPVRLGSEAGTGKAVSGQPEGTEERRGQAAGVSKRASNPAHSSQLIADS